MKNCEICPRGCGIDRTKEKGSCAVLWEPVVASVAPHFGEEPPISGNRGSGTIFFAGCNLNCVFCQNYDISQFDNGAKKTAAELAAIFRKLIEVIS